MMDLKQGYYQFDFYTFSRDLAFSAPCGNLNKITQNCSNILRIFEDIHQQDYILNDLF